MTIRKFGRDPVISVLIFSAFALGAFAGFKYANRSSSKESESISKDITETRKEITRPDGSKETTTVIVDRSKEKSDKSLLIVPKKPDWHVSLSAELMQAKDGPVYGLQVERRILGPFSVGARLSTAKSIGLTLGAEF